eukprot:CAMPEP_0115010092 /NCGR_PEP_ID=MMETSP0216-20121206/23076_1 /TAXON_ID=223996 /ORGANISM="Protocruzia adherens, Strain Boccale" /LENGTH=489 /DNA_ID=CAMNT_0002378173 /DNA_START=51 /DNA_END=1520 /DNA_ORIENTATION=+
MESANNVENKESEQGDLTEDRLELIHNYGAMTENHDFDTAVSTLREHNWDLHAAVNDFFAHQAAIHQNLATSTTPNTTHHHQHQHATALAGDAAELDTSTFTTQTTNLMPDSRTIRVNPRNNQPTSLLGGMMSMLKNIGSSVIYYLPFAIRGYYPGGEEFVRDFNEHYPNLTNKINFALGTYDEVCEEAARKRKLLLIILISFNADDSDSQEFVEHSLCKTANVDMIRENFVVWGVNMISEEGQKAADALSSTRTPYLAIIRQRRQTTRTVIKEKTGALTEDELLTFLSDAYEQNRTVEEQQQAARMQRIQEFYRSQGVQMPNQTRDPVYQARLEADRQLRDEQERELREAQELDRQRLERVRKEKEEVEELKRQAEEEKLKEEEKQRLLEEERKKKMEDLPEEPDKDDSEALEIVFRLPDGSKQSRRFNPVDKLEHLYHYIDTLGIKFEGDGEYELMQPRPYTLYESNDKSLVDAELETKALIFVKEK